MFSSSAVRERLYFVLWRVLTIKSLSISSRMFRRLRGMAVAQEMNRQILHPDALVRGHRRGVVHHVLQLAHVPRPIVGLEPRHHLGRQLLSRRSTATLREEVLDEERDVLLALTERGNREDSGVEPVVQVLAEETSCGSGRPGPCSSRR